MAEGRHRVVIEDVTPEVDCGAFPIKRTLGEKVVVEADVFAEGHDQISCVVLYRLETGSAKSREAGEGAVVPQAEKRVGSDAAGGRGVAVGGTAGVDATHATVPGKSGPRPAGGQEERQAEAEAGWQEAPMEPLVNDRWRGEFPVEALGTYRYTVRGWIDRFKSWRGDLNKRLQAGQEVPTELRIGCDLIEETADRAPERDAERLRGYARQVRVATREGVHQAFSPELASLMAQYQERRWATTYEKELPVTVDPVRARFGAWYEMFPRSASPDPNRPGTFSDVEARLPYVASMGFDILYLPPVHPIGRSFRKGRNNGVRANPTDPGSPWAIGAVEGGHDSIHPELGTLEDFRHLVKAAADHNLQIALDIAFQTTPDHPWVKDHPTWFRHRPDGTIQYAENPPKKYQDIYPLDFETDDWQALWQALEGVFLFWIDQGVRVFRVDNPHTKSFTFWRWVIPRIKAGYPEVVFLAEAFTRPKVMKRLAKLGFSQSYTYFAWRNTAWEIREYFTELTKTETREYYRPNLWPNTPDILTEYLQVGGRPAFMIRLALAATLGASYGIYGPPFELSVNQAIQPGSEEYLDSEKYQVSHWDINAPGSLRDVIARVNAIRRDNPALQSDWSLEFHPVNNDNLICYSKRTPDNSDVIVVVVNLDPHHTQAGTVELPVETFGLDADRPYQVHDLLGERRFLWHGRWNYVELNPNVMPAHIFRLRRYIRTEHDFDYYM